MPNKTHSTKVQQKQSCTTISKLWRHIFSNIMNMKRRQIYHNGHYVLQALQNKLLGKPYTRFISRSISSIPCKQKKENNTTTNDCYLQKLHLELASLQAACRSFLGKKMCRTFAVPITKLNQEIQRKRRSSYIQIDFHYTTIS